ncbi:acyl transferase/acyl hydrolase/lysophospholipase [Astrocystis sublimbata]|nr:acyl transferase/acyl hydrolase/lysophospholipase [Astrocystis sublimbata]
MATTCSHWVWTTAHEVPCIARSNRLDQLTSVLPQDAPAPSLVLMIGCRQRPTTYGRPQQRRGGVCLDLYNKDEASLLLGTATLQERLVTKGPCCRTLEESYPSSCASPAEADAVVYSQLLYPFVDVFCFYLYGPADLQVIAQQLIVWARTGPPLPRPGYTPQILIVLAGCRWKRHDVETAAETFHNLVGDATAGAPDPHLTDVSFLQLRRARRFKAILPILILHARAVRHNRQRARNLFSVRHCNALFNRAFHGVGSSSRVPFDCLRAARQDLPVSPDMSSHLINFAMLVKSAERLRDFAAPVVASSILLDQYPPGMHLFSPAEIYHKLYRGICEQVGEAIGEKHGGAGLATAGSFSARVLAHLEILFAQLVEGALASSVHKTVLAGYAVEWHALRSSRSCLTCLASMPQHFLSCGHSLCENCVRVFAQPEGHDPFLFRLHCCVLCQAPVDLVVRIRPPTAGHAILCIDGGGVRGVIPATVLELIEDCLDLPIPVQEHFSLAYGVSGGGLVVLGLYDRGWSAATCALQLQSFAAEAFRNPGPELLKSSAVLKVIRLLLFGRLYAARGIETALKRVFADKKMASPSYATTIGTKLGILTASVQKPLTTLFTNYNGVGEARAGYLVPRDSDTVKTWEVARSTSAAPMYFSPKHIPELGTFQDGGVLRNNPTMVGLSEFSALTKDTRPDLIINLGTGSDPGPLNEKLAGLWDDSWLARLARAYESLMQGRCTWNDAACLVKRESRHIGHYRLDIALQGEIRLDDVSSMPSLRSLVLQDTMLRDTIAEIAQRLFAALFYFELTALPTLVGSRYRIQGQMLCTRKAGDAALPRICQRLLGSTLLVDKTAVSFQLTYDRYGNAVLPLVFFTGQSFSLELKGDDPSLACPLSGSPYDRSTLIPRSGLAASFGTRCHGKRKADGDLPGRPCQQRRLV